MILTPAQNEIAADTHRFRVLNCGRRFGKTTLAVEEIKGKAVAKPSRSVYVAPTYQQARDIAWEQLKRELRNVTTSINESRLEIHTRTLQGGESLVVLRGWESIDTLRGQQFDFVVIDEVASMRNFSLHWEEVIRPTLTDTKGEALFISTPKGFNHFYDLYNKQDEDPDYKSFHFTTFNNTHIPPEELEKARQEIGEDRFAQEYLADFRKTQGLVYKDFNRERHVITDQQLNVLKTQGVVFRELLLGVDFGYTNPCAIVSVWRDHSDTMYVLEEFYKTRHTDAQVAEYVASLKANRVYPDPEAPAAIAELQKRGVNVREVVKGKDSIKNGINSVREAFRANKLFISASCKNLIWELETYSYADKKPDHNEDENPTKENDHLCDALRYVVMMNAAPTNQRAAQFYPNHTPVSQRQAPGNVRYPQLPKKMSF